MPNTLGTKTANIFFKLPSGGAISQKFTPGGLSYTLTFSTALITGNVVTGYIGGTLITRTYATSSAATLTALAADIAAVAGVKSAVSASLVITIVPKDQDNGIPVLAWTEASGSSQGTITIASVDNRVYPGMPVQISADGTIAPADKTAMFMNCIGVALNDDMQLPDGSTKEPEEITVLLKGLAIITAEALTTQNAGPVAISSYNTATGKMIYTTTVGSDDVLAGWSLDKVTGAGTAIRVIIK